MTTKMIYILLWWPSWYLLFFMYGTEGERQWVVTEKVSRYGQSLTLFCPVHNCCDKYAGWYTESWTIMIDVQIFSNDPNLKYGGTYNESGFGLIIRNLLETDLNKTYRCVYGVQSSTRKYLLQEDVFKKDELQWVVTEKVSRYGQSLTLFCPVHNCCDKYAGWSKESETIIIDVKTFSDDPNLKYGGTYNESGFGLIIRNLSETDLNKTYRCVYGVQISTRQYLLQEDVFKKGQLQWVVTEKVSRYGQSLTLFCPVHNCCDKYAGWSKESKTIIIDVKIYPDDPHLKFGGTYNESGFGLFIRNVSETDLNKTYQCVYGVQLSTHQYLLQEDVFKKDELKWVVTEKVSRYGQSLTLFCPVDNCCNRYAGWSKESKTIIIDAKIYPDDPHLKYGGTYNKSGFGLIIRHLSETDLNKTYQCVYGVQLSTRQYLLQEDVFKKEENSTTFVSEENSTTFVSEENSTGLSFREKLYYGLLAVGLALVLILTVLCSFYFCINRKCKKESGLILKESPTSALQILEENVPNGNQRISLVEMGEISLYESIDENQMLSNLALGMQSNVRTVRQLKRSQSTSSTTSSEKLYSEIADDNAYLNPNQPMTSDRESSNLLKYSTTSNTDKSLQKPQCDDVDEATIANQKGNDFVDVQNTSSTLLEADVVNLSDHERSSDDDTDGIIDKDDGYLHPYVPLMMNRMEYLHSYSSPINHDQLMKHNKSLISSSSPCDDMDKVSIAEQKTKDSVGKENAMNLSDHESSESDGDIDA